MKHFWVYIGFDRKNKSARQTKVSSRFVISNKSVKRFQHFKCFEQQFKLLKNEQKYKARQFVARKK